MILQNRLKVNNSSSFSLKKEFKNGIIKVLRLFKRLTSNLFLMAILAVAGGYGLIICFCYSVIYLGGIFQ